MDKQQTKQEEIEQGLKKLRLSERPHSGKNWPSFLSPDDVSKILSYLDSQGVVIKTKEETKLIPGGWLTEHDYEPLIKE